MTRSFTSPQIDRSVATMRSSVRPDGALGRVLDRHDRVVGLTAVDTAEDVVERRERHRLDEGAEMLGHGGVAERPGRTEIRDAHRLLERAARRHDLAEHARHRVVRQRTRVVGVQAAKHLRLRSGR